MIITYLSSSRARYVIAESENCWTEIFVECTITVCMYKSSFFSTCTHALWLLKYWKTSPKLNELEASRKMNRFKHNVVHV